MIRQFLILEMITSSQLIGQKLEQKEIERLEKAKYSTLLQEAECIRTAVLLHSQNEQAQFTHEMIELEKMKRDRKLLVQ